MTAQPPSVIPAQAATRFVVVTRGHYPSRHPAKAGMLSPIVRDYRLDPRLRGNDE